MKADLKRFRYIAVEGPIGVGKSSLARKLAEYLGAEVVLEQAQENPFLARFYEDMGGYAFQTQIFFLFQRVKQMQLTAQPGMFSGALVSDFLFAKDALFARMNLSDDEHRLYSQIHAQVSAPFSEPDLVIWLQAPPATLQQRIRKRALSEEQGISSDYLRRLCDAYIEYFHSYVGAPVFGVGTEFFNPIERDTDFAELLGRLSVFRGQREFFNTQGVGPFS